MCLPLAACRFRSLVIPRSTKLCTRCNLAGLLPSWRVLRTLAVSIIAAALHSYLLKSHIDTVRQMLWREDILGSHALCTTDSRHLARLMCIGLAQAVEGCPLQVSGHQLLGRLLWADTSHEAGSFHIKHLWLRCACVRGNVSNNNFPWVWQTQFVRGLILLLMLACVLLCWMCEYRCRRKFGIYFYLLGLQVAECRHCTP